MSSGSLCLFFPQVGYCKFLVAEIVCILLVIYMHVCLDVVSGLHAWCVSLGDLLFCAN